MSEKLKQAIAEKNRQRGRPLADVERLENLRQAIKPATSIPAPDIPRPRTSEGEAHDM